MRTTKAPFLTPPTLAALSGAPLIDAAWTILTAILPRSWSVETVEHDDGTRSLVAMSPDASTTYRVSATARGLALEALGDDDELRFLCTSRTAGSMALILDHRIRHYDASPRAA